MVNRTTFGILSNRRLVLDVDTSSLQRRVRGPLFLTTIRISQKYQNIYVVFYFNNYNIRTPVFTTVSRWIDPDVFTKRKDSLQIQNLYLSIENFPIECMYKVCDSRNKRDHRLVKE